MWATMPSKFSVTCDGSTTTEATWERRPVPASKADNGVNAPMGIGVEEMSPVQSRALLVQFLGDFVDPERKDSFALALRRSPVRQRPVDYERVLRSDRIVSDAGGTDLLRWLSRDGTSPYCHFFQRQAWKPAARFLISSLSEPISTSWPGIFVNFDAGRALVVTARSGAVSL